MYFSKSQTKRQYICPECDKKLPSLAGLRGHLRRENHSLGKWRSKYFSINKLGHLFQIKNLKSMVQIIDFQHPYVHVHSIASFINIATKLHRNCIYFSVGLSGGSGGEAQE